MPKSPFTSSVWDNITVKKESQPKATITLSPDELPREVKVKPQPVKRQRKAPKPKKKSNLVSLYKKKVRLENSGANLESAVPKELTEQQDNEARLKKRRNSKLHPREEESTVADGGEGPSASFLSKREQIFDELTKDVNELEQASQHEFIKRHNAQVKSKKKSSVVLDQMPPPDKPTLKPLLNNGKVGLSGDVKTLVEFATKFHAKNLRASRKLRNFAEFIPMKELKRKNFLQALKTLDDNAEEVVQLPAKISAAIKHAVSKSVFETRFARITPNCTLTNLAYDPSTTKFAEEQAIRLKRTPLVRSHIEHEQEANVMLRRHEATLKAEIQHSHDVATSEESLASSQMAILALYRKTIDSAKIDEQAKLSYRADLEGTIRLMQLVMIEHRRHRDQLASENPINNDDDEQEVDNLYED